LLIVLCMGTISKTSYFDREFIKIDNYIDTDLSLLGIDIKRVYWVCDTKCLMFDKHQIGVNPCLEI